MKLEFVLPLLGETGGAERTLASLGRQITATSDWEVTIQTTCASSATTWANDLPAGITHQDKLAVHRHIVDSGRTSAWPKLLRAVNNTPRFISAAKAQAYLIAQGPISSSLAQSLATSEADLALHMPYPYWTTLALAGEQQKPTLIWPAAHDEPGLKLSTVREALCGVDGLVFGSEAERRLTETNHPIAHKRQIVLGIGIDEHPGDSVAALEAIGLGPAGLNSAGLNSAGLNSAGLSSTGLNSAGPDGRPWVVCVGRMLVGKGTEALAQMWSDYVKRYKPDHRLIFVGEPSLKIEPDEHVYVAGEVDEQTKWGLIRGADVLIHPGRQESFGVVLLEAWAANTAVLVNDYCGPTSDHVNNSGGGATFRDSESFATKLHAMLTNPELRQTMADNGNSYWRNNYTWDKITPRFMDFCERVKKFQRAHQQA